MSKNDQEKWIFKDLLPQEHSLILRLTDLDPMKRLTATQAYEEALKFESDNYILGIAESNLDVTHKDQLEN